MIGTWRLIAYTAQDDRAVSRTIRSARTLTAF
jgi:hypothetical protein